MDKTEILIIGGGVIGLACAWRLAQAGRKVILLEAKECGAGATRASLGVLMPYGAESSKPIAIRQRQSLFLYPAFVKELFLETGIDVGYTPLGRLHFLQSVNQREKLSGGAEIACATWPKISGTAPVQEVLSYEEAKKIEPEADFGEFGALFCRLTARVCPVGLTQALKGACRKSGAEIREHSHVSDIIYEGEKAIGVRSGTGPVMAEKILICTGAWSSKLLNDSQKEEVAVTPLKGQALELQCSKLPVRRLVRGLGVYVLPLAGNRVMIGATKEDAGFDETVTPEGEDVLLNKAERLVPALAEAKVSRAWASLRPHRIAGEPFEGKVCGTANLYVVSGHGGMGICMAPIVAQQVEEVLNS